MSVLQCSTSTSATYCIVSKEKTLSEPSGNMFLRFWVNCTFNRHISVGRRVAAVSMGGVLSVSHHHCNNTVSSCPCPLWSTGISLWCRLSLLTAATSDKSIHSIILSLTQKHSANLPVCSFNKPHNAALTQQQTPELLHSRKTHDAPTNPHKQFQK